MTYMSDELILGRRLADGYELDHSELSCKLRKMLDLPELPRDASASVPGPDSAAQRSSSVQAQVLLQYSAIEYKYSILYSYSCIKLVPLSV